MSINDTITMTGRIGTEVTYRAANQASKAYARFRMVVPRTHRNEAGQRIELEPLWYTVRCWGSLATNIAESLRKGQPIIVVGKARPSAWIDNDGNLKSEIAINAHAIGPDLNNGTSHYQRTPFTAAPAEPPTPNEDIAPF